MDGDEAKESALDCASSAATTMRLDASCEHQSTQSTKKQQKSRRGREPSLNWILSIKNLYSAEWHLVCILFSDRRLQVPQLTLSGSAERSN